MVTLCAREVEQWTGRKRRRRGRRRSDGCYEGVDWGRAWLSQHSAEQEGRSYQERAQQTERGKGISFESECERERGRERGRGKGRGLHQQHCERRDSLAADVAGRSYWWATGAAVAAAAAAASVDVLESP